MASLLIDFDNIIKPNQLPRLKNCIQPIPYTKFSIGLVLVITKEEKMALQNIPKGEGRVNYLNSYSFVQSIRGHAYLIYDRKKRVCEIMGMKGDILPWILESTLSNIPNDVILWVGITLESPYLDLMIKKYVEVGFHEPYICKASPLGFSFSGYGLCMFRENNIVNNNAINDVKYVITQLLAKEKGYCTLQARLSDKAIEYLRHVSKMGSTINDDGVITQKEIAGCLLTSIIDKNLTYHLDVDLDSIVYGEEEGVEIIGGLYNFHSHPQEAYDRHDIKLGWPSAQDYIGFLGSSIKYNTILHIVSSLEGFYVISLSNYWVNHKKDLDINVVNFVMEKYDFKHKKNQTSTWYVRTVNGISYGGFPIFLVQFFSWYDARTFFIVPYHNIGVNCFARQSTEDKYIKLYYNV